MVRSAFIFALLLAQSGPGLEFFIATNGVDSNPGARARPFGTLERARDAIRQMRQDGQPAREGFTVFLRGGDYARTNAFELALPDSGAPEAPVVWQAANGETARLLGGRRLAGFQPVTNAAVLARLDETARVHILQLDLRRLGLTDFGEMKSRGFARATAPAQAELFFEGRPMTLARWPNEGEWEHIAAFPESAGAANGKSRTAGALEEGFFYSGERPCLWQDTSNLWVHGYWTYDWANSYERVIALDCERHQVRTAPPYGNYGFAKGQRFYFLNVLEELDQPGEWFLDHTTGILYFWPPTPIGPGSEVLLSLLAQPLLSLNAVSNLTVRGLTLEAARGNAVEIRGGTRNRVSGCTICNVGNAAVTIDGGFGHGVERCAIFDTGDGGVSLRGGDRRTLAPGGHFVEDCHFARQGRWSKCYVPAVLMEGAGLRASHNLIHHHPHCGILFTGNDHIIEFNEIHHVALETGDVGAIYSGRDYTYRGNRIRFNFIHHTGGVGMGSMGIYMDDCVSGTEIFGNIFYQVQRAAFLGGGRDHLVINNVFVDCNYAVELDGRGIDTSPNWRDMVDKTMRERLAEAQLTLYRERYPALKALDAYYGPPGGPPIAGKAFTGVPPENNVVARNICVGKWLKVYWHATTQMLRLENNLTNSPPGFAGQPGDHAQAKDFDLTPDSPAWKLGFQRIPVESIGPRRGRATTSE